MYSFVSDQRSTTATQGEPRNLMLLTPHFPQPLQWNHQIIQIYGEIKEPVNQAALPHKLYHVKILRRL